MTKWHFRYQGTDQAVFLDAYHCHSGPADRDVVGRLTEARARYVETLADRVRPGSSYRISEAREQVRYWERKVQEMLAGG